MMAEVVNIVEPKEFSGHTIELNADWSFTVTGPEFNHIEMRKRMFLSLVDARAAIQTALHEKEKFEAAKIHLHLEVIDEENRFHVVDKINRRNGYLVGLEDAPALVGRSAKMYPNVPWVREAVKRFAEITKERSELAKRLDGLEMDVNRHRYNSGRVDADDAVRYTKRLQDEYDEKTKKAIEMAKTKLELVTGQSA
jgi:hypothetical protein